MSTELDRPADGAPAGGIARYAPLGLIANPFVTGVGASEPGIECEIAAAGNALLVAILGKSREGSPRPLWVDKNADIPASFGLFAMSHAERSLATDDSLNVLYGYVQMFMMKVGLVRATLGVLAERLAFRSFGRTLELWVAEVLKAPDENLPSYQVLGPEGLATFAARFAEDPTSAVDAVFGAQEDERRPELAEVPDLRLLTMDDDGEESESTAEVDATVGDAPGTEVLLEETADGAADDEREVLDYLVEYTREHLSPVIGRGLRVYHDRGSIALTEELKVTKAPRKTLANVVELADVRYQKVALIYDAFESWLQVDADLRSKLIASLSDIRWKNAGKAFPVFVVAKDEAPELEEAFGQATRLEWMFSGVLPMQESPDTILPDVVNSWLSSAALSGATPFRLGQGALADLAASADGSLARFVDMASRAFESAADRGVDSLDAESIEAARAEGAE